MIFSNATFLLLLEVEVGDGGRAALGKKTKVGVHEVVADHVEGSGNDTGLVSCLFGAEVVVTHMVTRPQRG